MADLELHAWFATALAVDEHVAQVKKVAQASARRARTGRRRR
ncbi:hypothetical protein ACFWGN_16140 [Oerskovia sp. NPDC060338]